ncbi:hypothetical protein LTR12_015795 [Friedmanniomyces endolithicus]|nr:hypothetical protein LTR12_015795 [Friedmanniomyces endolithicus]
MTSLTLTFVERPPLSLSFTAGTVPLTTVFSPPPPCTSGPWVSVESTQGTITCTRSLDSSLTASCYPSEFVAGAAVLYSPGICPSQYSAAASWTTEGSNATTSICCPSGMAYLQLASSCEATLGNTPASNGFPTVVINNSTVQYSNAFTAFAPTIAVAWAFTDLDRYTPASAPIFATDLTAATIGSSTATTTSASQSNPTTSSSTLSTPIQSGSSLSTGATAGIGVDAALGGLALIALGAWLFLRRRKSRAAGGADDNHGKAELPGESAEKQRTKAGELSTRGEIFEFGGDARPAELEPDVRYELEGGFQGNEAGGTMRRST